MKKIFVLLLIILIFVFVVGCTKDIQSAETDGNSDGVSFGDNEVDLSANGTESVDGSTDTSSATKDTNKEWTKVY